jgi:long-chain acyl-CoA synthetase
MPNSVEYVIAYFACWRLGVLAGPINSHLKEQEISYVVSNSEAKVLLVGTEFLPVINPLRDLPTLNADILFDDEAQATRDFTKVEATADVSLDDEAIIIYTSGTTGKPKGCLLTHGNLVANARQISQWLGFNESDRLLTLMPLFP